MSIMSRSYYVRVVLRRGSMFGTCPVQLEYLVYSRERAFFLG